MKHFPILNGRCYVVELDEPQGILPPDFKNTISLDGTWQIVGMLPEVTEKQAAGMVEGGKIPFDETASAYRDYSYKSEWGATWLSTAIESLESAIRAEGLYLDSPPFKQTKFTNPDIWESVMSRVLCRERCLVLRRES